MQFPITQRHPITPDHKYDSQEIAKFINYIMEDGKKAVARKVVYDAMEIIAGKKEQDPIDVFEAAIENVGPKMEVRGKRVGGANYQVPYEVDQKRRLQLALRWIKEATLSNQKGEPIANALARELMAAAAGEGEAVKKRENAHKQADANKAFAHFAR
ncbi:MAG: 30S ribosomal protein S7 [Candidatus Paceibacterota bacterium]